MTEHYRHLQAEDRVILYELINQGCAIQDIANVIGCHKTTIYRELHRNSSELGYRPDMAHQQYRQRIYDKRVSLLERPSELKSFIINKLKDSWSPELISGYLKRKAGRNIISHETIYRFIYSKTARHLKLYRYLYKKRRFRYPRVKRRRRMVMKARKRSIHSRPSSINNRSRYGHWEGDLILFRHTQANLFTLRERKSRLVIALKNSSRHAKSTTKTLVKYMKSSLKKTVKTLTLDNGVEFLDFETMEKKLKALIYFCDPYKSYQKGAIENANRLLRTVFPRSMNTEKLSQQGVDKAVKKLNDRPMKCLDFQTPNEVFFRVFGINAI